MSDWFNNFLEEDDEELDNIDPSDLLKTFDDSENMEPHLGDYDPNRISPIKGKGMGGYPVVTPLMHGGLDYSGQRTSSSNYSRGTARSQSDCPEGKVYNAARNACYDPTNYNDPYHPSAYLNKGNGEYVPGKASLDYINGTGNTEEEDIFKRAAEVDALIQNDGYEFDISAAKHYDEQMGEMSLKAIRNTIHGTSHLQDQREVAKNRRSGVSAYDETYQNTARYQKQTFGDMLGNALVTGVTSALLQTGQNVAAILDVFDVMNEDNEYGNWMSAGLKDLENQVKDRFEIYTLNDKQWSSLAWWMKSGSEVMASAGAFYLTGMGTNALFGRMFGNLHGRTKAKIIGDANKVKESVKNSKKFDNISDPLKKQVAIDNAVDAALAKRKFYADLLTSPLNPSTGSAVVLSQAAAMSQGMNVYSDAYDYAIDANFSDHAARAIAAQAAATNANGVRLTFLLNMTALNSLGKLAGMAKLSTASGVGGSFMRKLPTNLFKSDRAGYAVTREMTQESIEENVEMASEKAATRLYKSLATKEGSQYIDYTYRYDSPTGMQMLGQFAKGMAFTFAPYIAPSVAMYQGSVGLRNLLTGKVYDDLTTENKGFRGSWYDDVTTNDILTSAVLGALGATGMVGATRLSARLGNSDGNGGVKGTIGRVFGNKVLNITENEADIQYAADGRIINDINAGRVITREDVAAETVEYKANDRLISDVVIQEAINPKGDTEFVTTAGKVPNLAHVKGAEEVLDSTGAVIDYKKDSNGRYIGVSYDANGQMETFTYKNKKYAKGTDGLATKATTLYAGDVVTDEMAQQLKDNKIYREEKGKAKLAVNSLGIAMETNASKAARAVDPNAKPEYHKAYIEVKDTKGRIQSDYKKSATGGFITESKKNRERRQEAEAKKIGKILEEAFKVQKINEQTFRVNNSAAQAGLMFNRFLDTQVDPAEKPKLLRELARHLVAVELATVSNPAAISTAEFEKLVTEKVKNELTDDKFVETYEKSIRKISEYTFVNSVGAALENGYYDILAAQVEDMKRLTPEQAKQLGYGDNHVEFFDSVLADLKLMKTTFDAYSEQYGPSVARKLMQNRDVTRRALKETQEIDKRINQLIKEQAEEICKSSLDGQGVAQLDVEEVIRILSDRFYKKITDREAAEKIAANMLSLKDYVSDETHARQVKEKEDKIAKLETQIKELRANPQYAALRTSEIQIRLSTVDKALSKLEANNSPDTDKINELKAEQKLLLDELENLNKVLGSNEDYIKALNDELSKRQNALNEFNSRKINGQYVATLVTSAAAKSNDYNPENPNQPSSRTADEQKLLEQSRGLENAIKEQEKLIKDLAAKTVETQKELKDKYIATRDALAKEKQDLEKMKETQEKAVETKKQKERILEMIRKSTTDEANTMAARQSEIAKRNRDILNHKNKELTLLEKQIAKISARINELEQNKNLVTGKAKMEQLQGILETLKGMYGSDANVSHLFTGIDVNVTAYTDLEAVIAEAKKELERLHKETAVEHSSGTVTHNYNESQQAEKEGHELTIKNANDALNDVLNKAVADVDTLITELKKLVKNETIISAVADGNYVLSGLRIELTEMLNKLSDEGIEGNVKNFYLNTPENFQILLDSVMYQILHMKSTDGAKDIIDAINTNLKKAYSNFQGISGDTITALNANNNLVNLYNSFRKLAGFVKSINAATSSTIDIKKGMTASTVELGEGLQLIFKGNDVILTDGTIEFQITALIPNYKRPSGNDAILAATKKYLNQLFEHHLLISPL